MISRKGFARTATIFAGCGASALMGCASAQKAWTENNTISIPECSVAFSSSTQGKAFSNQFSNKGLSTTMVVFTPLKENGDTFQQIADESCDRLQKKLAGLGYTVVTGKELLAKSEKYAELSKEYFTKEPDGRDQLVYFGSSKTGVPKGGAGFSVNMGYGSMGRNNNGIVFAPMIAVTFGDVKTSGSSVTDGGGMTTSTTTAKYNPTVAIKKDSSSAMWMMGDQTGRLEVSKNISNDSSAWLIDVEKGDTNTSALSVVGNLAFGSRVEKTAYYSMKVDAAKMKASIMSQLDVAENDFIDQIKKIKGN